MGSARRALDLTLLALGLTIFAWGWWRVAQSEYAPSPWLIAPLLACVALASLAWEPLTLLAGGIALHAKWTGGVFFNHVAGSGGQWSNAEPLIAVFEGLLASTVVCALAIARSWIDGRHRRGRPLAWFIGMGSLIWGYLLFQYAVIWGAVDAGPPGTFLWPLGWVWVCLAVAATVALWGNAAAALDRRRWRMAAIATVVVGIAWTGFLVSWMLPGIKTPTERWQQWEYTHSSTGIAPTEIELRPRVTVRRDGDFVLNRERLSAEELQTELTRIAKMLSPSERIHFVDDWGRANLVQLAIASRLAHGAGISNLALAVKPDVPARDWVMRLADLAVNGGTPWTLPLPPFEPDGDLTLPASAPWQDLVDALDAARQQGQPIRAITLID